jgi:hypothetical protein
MSLFFLSSAKERYIVVVEYMKSYNSNHEKINSVERFSLNFCVQLL